MDLELRNHKRRAKPKPVGTRRRRNAVPECEDDLLPFPEPSIDPFDVDIGQPTHKEE